MDAENIILDDVIAKCLHAILLWSPFTNEHKVQIPMKVMKHINKLAIEAGGHEKLFLSECYVGVL